jgi:hypothetical protein
MVPESQPIKQPFSNVQLELLKVFSYQISDSDLIELRRLLAQFFAQKAVEAADAAWEDNNWTDADIERLLNTKLRTPYKK